MSISQDKKHRFIQLRANGLSFNKISEEIQVSKPTLIEWSKVFQFEIANLRAIEMEALQQECYVAKRARIKLLGKQLKLIETELNSRKDISKLPTKDLVRLKLAYAKALKDEEVNLVFVKDTGIGISMDQLRQTTTWNM